MPVPPHAVARGTRRAGFTLIEILVVLGILAALMGIAFGLIGSLGQQDKLVVAESLIVDAVRQVRHTARTTGGPAMVRIYQDDAADRKWRISGTARTPVRTWTFDEGGNATLGRTGGGQRLVEGTEIEAPLTSREAIGRFGRNEGFSIILDARPPAAYACSVGTVIPLVVIGAGPEIDQTQIVLYLKSVKRTVQSAPQAVIARAWSVRALVRFQPSPPGAPPDEFAVTSLPDENPNPDPTLGDASDLIDPITGETWSEFGMAYDGRVLSVSRNGRTLKSDDRMTLDNRLWQPARTSSGSEDIKIILGKLITGDGAGQTTWHGAGTLIDNVRVYRHATSNLATFPVGLTWPKGVGEYRIAATPDGIVRFFADNDLTKLKIVGPTGATLDIDIPANGIVASSIDQPRPKP